MQKFSIFCVFVTYFLLLKGFYAEAKDIKRLRYFVPTSAESEITFGSKKNTEQHSISGHSGNFVFANGIGVGYCTERSNISLEGVSHSFRNNILDLSYTIGDSVSFSFGAGQLINGRGELILTDVSYVTENSKGGSIFISFGIPFLGGDFLLGYRQNNVEYKNYKNQFSSNTVTLAEPVKLLSRNVNIGIGLIF